MSIVTVLIDQVIDIAQRNRLKDVQVVVLVAGQLRQVVPEMMQEAFKAVIPGTIVEGAVLRVEAEAALVRCRACQAEYQPDVDDFICRSCQKADVEILRGNDIILKTIEGNK
ncbi:MAG: hydrogenase maturation nickel metallochaperone HypA [Candidatus Omnitrophica bacterium]|nr:hydrogenase maturation nickel metallochaperone HypA [Candidatus Omnitrophota bacterium]